MPWEKGVTITPLPGLHRTAYMTEAIEDARAKGARVVNEGGGAFSMTLFYPAVVYPVREGMKLYREEQFGPIIPVMPFINVEDALEYVVTSDHGQQVSIFGSNPGQIGALVDPLVNQVCRVNINCQCQRGPDVFPFAGRKDSAEGTLSVADACVRSPSARWWRRSRPRPAKICSMRSSSSTSRNSSIPASFSDPALPEPLIIRLIAITPAVT
jgi:acyl-CoA reductase-like NAD-dependent aldehyde dehydrogenase